jgi:hypothetical protein
LASFQRGVTTPGLVARLETLAAVRVAGRRGAGRRR